MSLQKELNMKILIIVLLNLFLNNIQIYGQVLPVENLFDFESIFQQKNIRVSERIKKEWNLPSNFIQQTYYNAHKDSYIDSVQLITQVLSINYLINDTLKILELLDDGKHFDKNANDGIYGNILDGDFNVFRTDESNIDIQLDTIGINYRIVYSPVNYLPDISTIIIPQHQSIVSSEMHEISWEIDPKADGCGAILLGNTPVFGEHLDEIIWIKEYKANSNNVFTEKIPVQLSNNKEYILVVWSYTDTKQINGKWSRGSYSIEWSKFVVDTLRRIKELILSQNSPNPFNSRTTIKYNLPESGKISVKIFDIIGREINALINQEQASGEHYVLWNGKDDFGKNVASGIYFYAIAFGNRSLSRKMILIR